MSETGTEHIAICATCVMWAQESSAIGYCHRFPSVLPTSPSHWCGEHKPLGNGLSADASPNQSLGYERPEQMQPRRPGRPRKIV